MKKTLSIEAAEPDAYMGLGSVAYAVAKSDGKLQSEELETVRRLFSTELYGDLAIRSFLIQEYHDESVEAAYAFAMRRVVASRQVLDGDMIKHFVSVLQQVADSSDGTSAGEKALIRRFQRDIDKLRADVAQ